MSESFEIHTSFSRNFDSTIKKFEKIYDPFESSYDYACKEI